MRRKVADLNSVIELHDSVVVGIVQHGDDVLIKFSPVYIHKSEGEPGWDAGSGWVQDAELIFLNSIAPEFQTELSADITEGSLMLGNKLLDNVIPIPLDYVGIARLSIVFSGTAEQVEITGSRVTLILLGEAEYVEEFSGSS